MIATHCRQHRPPKGGYVKVNGKKKLDKRFRLLLFGVVASRHSNSVLENSEVLSD